MADYKVNLEKKVLGKGKFPPLGPKPYPVPKCVIDDMIEERREEIEKSPEYKQLLNNNSKE